MATPSAKRCKNMVKEVTITLPVPDQELLALITSYAKDYKYENVETIILEGLFIPDRTDWKHGALVALGLLMDRSLSLKRHLVIDVSQFHRKFGPKFLVCDWYDILDVAKRHSPQGFASLTLKSNGKPIIDYDVKGTGKDVEALAKLFLTIKVEKISLDHVEVTAHRDFSNLVAAMAVSPRAVEMKHVCWTGHIEQFAWPKVVVNTIYHETAVESLSFSDCDDHTTMALIKRGLLEYKVEDEIQSSRVRMPIGTIIPMSNRLVHVSVTDIREGHSYPDKEFTDSILMLLENMKTNKKLRTLSIDLTGSPTMVRFFNANEETVKRIQEAMEDLVHPNRGNNQVIGQLEFRPVVKTAVTQMWLDRNHAGRGYLIKNQGMHGAWFNALAQSTENFDVSHWLLSENAPAFFKDAGDQVSDK